MKPFLLFSFLTLFLFSCSRSLYTETGVASWYGDDFHGKKTANGEIFSKRKLTAAHKTLNFNCMVKVTNLDNGKSVVVRINDRGPFVKGRIIDLSKKAAKKIGLIKSGTAKVKIVAVENYKKGK
ncbi:MAG: hypothetical protein A3H98_03440 [Bacteroidetes bacterium RIFCSPLOWO2_02_FULL_36_8]|nr:MAG: hypothetical protein A3H98_03440 [Bacteroidetes bacterium RIFCSPLOWO2_02_FULL_36_8]OFY69496.1 MAG: hypothetical protein A3G23_10685 [Bacteroidetes bacterium RIFCSPLOWO2_12_FULL_37_12]